MRINVISIVGSVREKLAVSRLTDMGFVVDLFPAFDFREKQLSELNAIAKLREFSDRYSRPPSAGEIGCSLSHLKLIKSFRMAGGKDYEVVFEDDALPKVPGQEFENICDELSNAPFDVILLGYAKTDEKNESYINIVNPFYPLRRASNAAYAVGVRYSDSLAGAVGYLVKKSAILKLAELEKVEHLADDWSFFSSLGLRIGHVSPMLVKEDYLSLVSTLEHDHIARPRFFENRMARSLRSIRGTLRRIRLIIRCKLIYGKWPGEGA